MYSNSAFNSFSPSKRALKKSTVKIDVFLWWWMSNTARPKATGHEILIMSTILTMSGSKVVMHHGSPCFLVNLPKGFPIQVVDIWYHCFCPRSGYFCSILSIYHPINRPWGHFSIFFHSFFICITIFLHCCSIIVQACNSLLDDTVFLHPLHHFMSLKLFTFFPFVRIIVPSTIPSCITLTSSSNKMWDQLEWYQELATLECTLFPHTLSRGRGVLFSLCIRKMTMCVYSFKMDFHLLKMSSSQKRRWSCDNDLLSCRICAEVCSQNSTRNYWQENLYIYIYCGVLRDTNQPIRMVLLCGFYPRSSLRPIACHPLPSYLS